MDARYKSNKKMGDVEREVYPTEEVRKRSELCGTRTMSSVHRARFLEEMVKLLPDGVASFNKVFSRLEEQDQEVILYFTDGTEVRVDAVVGCDGIKSKVRLSMMKGIGQVVEPQYVGEYAYRSLVDATIAKAILGEQLAANCNVWEGYGGYIIHYPIEGGRMINVVGVKQDTGPAREHSSEQLVNPVPRKTMDRDWKDWDPRLQRLLQEFKTSDQWSLWSLQHDQKYFRGRVCVMGDAAHATAPHLGSGAGMAIEDAYILGSLLALVKTKTDLEIAFAEYDAIRRPRTQQLIAKSKDAGKKLCFALTGIEDDFEALQAYSESQFRWIWELDLEQQLQEAKEIYERSRAA
jgi:salicylate hydroxylase